MGVYGGHGSSRGRNPSMKSIVGLVLLVALCIPIVVMLIQSPIGRTFRRRPDRPPHRSPDPDAELADVRRRLDLVEGDVEILQHALREARDHAEYLQELIEQSGRTDLPRGRG